MIVTTRYIIHPFLVVQVPANSLFDSFFKLQTRLPAQFFLQFCGVNGVTHVVTLAVRYVGYQVHVFSFLASQQAVYRSDHYLDDVDVLPFVETADVVGFGHFSLMEDEVDGTGVVYHVQPVTHVLALTVYRQRLAVTDVVDEQRNQFFRELVRPVVVRTVGYDGGHAVCIVEGTDKMVTAGLRSRIGAVRVVFGVFVEEILSVSQVMFRRGSRGGERRFDTFRMCQFQGAVYFVRRDVVKAFAFIAFRQAFPIDFGGLKQAQGTHYVGTGKGEWIFDAAVHVAFGGQVNDTVYVVLLHHFLHLLVIADVCLHEDIVLLVLDVFQVGQVTGIRQLVQVDDAVFRILVHEEANHMAADESGTAGNQYVAFECTHNKDGLRVSYSLSGARCTLSANPSSRGYADRKSP